MNNRNFDRNLNRATKGFFVFWGISVIFSLVFWAVLIWAIIQGVGWLQSQ